MDELKTVILVASATVMLIIVGVVLFETPRDAECRVRWEQISSAEDSLDLFREFPYCVERRP